MKRLLPKGKERPRLLRSFSLASLCLKAKTVWVASLPRPSLIIEQGTLYALRYEKAFLPKGKKRPHYKARMLHKHIDRQTN